MPYGRRIHRVTVVGPSRGEMERVFGTNIVPIDPPMPSVVNLSDGNLTGVYDIDLDELSEFQRGSLAKHIADAEGISAVEAGRLLKQEGFTILADHCLMEEFTHEQLGSVRDLYRDRYTGRDPIHEAFVIASQITHFMLGRSWVQWNILAQSSHVEARLRFLRIKGEEHLSGFHRQDRLIGLADILFTLQRCRGFDRKLEELRALSPLRPMVHLEDLYAELEIAAMLVKNGSDIEFVGPTGLKESDFDLLIRSSAGTSYPAEVKCKREDTPGDALALRRTLRKAAQQLPRDSLGLAVVRIPEVWIQDQELSVKVVRTISKFVNGPTRLLAVVLVWEQWHRWIRDAHIRMQMVRAFVRSGISEESSKDIAALWHHPLLSLSYGTFF
jgi:hypothetical protein